MSQVVFLHLRNATEECISYWARQNDVPRTENIDGEEVNRSIEDMEIAIQDAMENTQKAFMLRTLNKASLAEFRTKQAEEDKNYSLLKPVEEDVEVVVEVVDEVVEE